MFGEFKIDKLVPNSGRYRLVIKKGSTHTGAADFELAEESLYLGKINLA